MSRGLELTEEVGLLPSLPTECSSRQTQTGTPSARGKGEEEGRAELVIE